MRYYLDQEFHEYFRKPISWLPTIGKFNRPFHTIELISIGIVSEFNEIFYRVCYDFDVDAAWKNTWLRDNVLYPIFRDAWDRLDGSQPFHLDVGPGFTKSNFKKMLKWVGYNKKSIKNHVNEFLCPVYVASEYAEVGSLESGFEAFLKLHPPVFHGYYADYDWVLFCSLYGTMMDLPKGFPMYCIDLKQDLDYFSQTDKGQMLAHVGEPIPEIHEHIPVDLAVERIKTCPLVNYPKEENEHHALADARWIKKLHEFLLNLK